MKLLQIKDENEFLKILEALEQKLGYLSHYENLLIKEANNLKEMYHDISNSQKTTEELLKKFEEQRIWFFSDFSYRIRDAMKTELRDLLSEYNISVTLSKGEKE